MESAQTFAIRIQTLLDLSSGDWPRFALHPKNTAPVIKLILLTASFVRFEEPSPLYTCLAATSAIIYVWLPRVSLSCFADRRFAVGARAGSNRVALCYRFNYPELLTRIRKINVSSNVVLISPLPYL